MHVVQISIRGRLEILCEKRSISVARPFQSKVLWSPPLDPRSPSPDGYHLNLLVPLFCRRRLFPRGSDQTCHSKKVVWKSDGYFRSHKIERLPRCDANIEMDLHHDCDNFPKNVAHFLRDEEKITLMISFYSRYDILLSQIQYYAANSLIPTILVTRHNEKIKPPSTTRVDNSFVYFVTPNVNSLNNRFNPDLQIYTEFVIDDDMRIHLQDIYNLFEVWKRNRTKQGLGFRV